MRALLVFSCLVLVCTGAVAQTEAPAEGPVEAPVEVRYQKQTVIEIGNVDIMGTVKGPTVGRVHSGRRPSRRSLIALRPDFRPELLASPSAL